MCNKQTERHQIENGCINKLKANDVNCVCDFFCKFKYTFRGLYQLRRFKLLSKQAIAPQTKLN